MTKLIEKNSSLYKRRMVKEIRKHWPGGSVYYGAYRVYSVRFHKGELYVNINHGEPDGWRCADADGFRDGSGREIVVSREARVR